MVNASEPRRFGDVFDRQGSNGRPRIAAQHNRRAKPNDPVDEIQPQEAGGDATAPFHQKPGDATAGDGAQRG